MYCLNQEVLNGKLKTILLNFYMILLFMSPFQMPQLHVIHKKTVPKYTMQPDHIIRKYSYFKGTKGIITWEKAGYARKDVFAELNDYKINTTRSSFTIDSVKLTHTTYFKKPVSRITY